MLLTQTTTPEDVKALNRAELPQLCSEIRHAILESSAAVGGHVAPNLGVVELTVALHRVFNSPTDKIVFDVSHQTYAHKALTGRAYTYIDPERFGEASGFANPDESEHDLFAMGHTSTSVSLGCGLAHARDLAGDTYNVITVIGDGSLSGGLAFEGFNNAAELDSNLIIIVNDNDQSIAENHGGLYRNLAELRASNGTCERNVFRAMGLDYRYLDAGNDVLALVDALQELRNIDHPIVRTSPPPRARALSRPRATRSAGTTWVRLTWRLGASSARVIRASLRRAPMPTLRARRSAPPSSAIRRSWASRPPHPTSWALHPSFALPPANSSSMWALPRSTP